MKETISEKFQISDFLSDFVEDGDLIFSELEPEINKKLFLHRCYPNFYKSQQKNALLSGQRNMQIFITIS